MQSRELLFEPKRSSLFKRSPFYILSLIAKSILLCSQYLMDATGTTADIALTDKYIDRFWRAHFQITRTTLYVTGRGNLRPYENYVFMSNHESWMDIPAMFATAPPSLRMVSKLGLTQFPIVGKAMLNGGFIAVDRKNRNKAIKQLEDAKERLKSGISIWIAPEGTRSRDGSLKPFKKGGFHLARELGISIVPVYIEGAGQVMPADGMWVYPNRSITVHFCAPISTVGFDRSHTNELIEKVRHVIVDKKRECQEQQAKFEAINDTL